MPIDKTKMSQMNAGTSYPEAGTLLDFFKTLDKEVRDLPAEAVLFLMKVMDKPGVRMDEIQADLDMTQTKVSRYAQRLSAEFWDQHNRIRKPGPDLVKTRPDDVEPRRFQVHLTSKGHALAVKLVKVMTP